MNADAQIIELTILMPCLNEAQTLGTCVKKARDFIARTGISAEIVIADNGSDDGSQGIATGLGARVVAVPVRGYGAALIAGISAARGEFVIMADSDDSYDFSQLDQFVEQLRKGADLVMGNRFKGGIRKGAMPPLHRYLGNPVLSGIGRMFFRTPCGDFHCGLRGFRRASILQLGLHAPGMEFASEMVVKASLAGLSISEVPTILHPDGRNRPPHLRSWRDGWRHLRFLLLFSPKWLFYIPGLSALTIGLLGAGWLLPGDRSWSTIRFGIHTLFYCCILANVGYQLCQFGLFTQTFASREGWLPKSKTTNALVSIVTLELGLVIGAALVLIGCAGALLALSSWKEAAFGILDPVQVMRIVLPSGTAILLGFQTIAGAFFLSVLGIRAK